MGAARHKAFLELAGRPLFVHAVEALACIERIEQIVIVVHPDDTHAAEDALSSWTSAAASVIVGAATRRESSLAGIAAASGESVLIHDGCRPFVSRELIERVLDAIEAFGAAVPVLPSIETLYRTEPSNDRLLELVDRRTIVRAQTPQGFRRERILRCLRAANPGVTDDASAMLACGEPVHAVPGEPANRKITVPEDLRWAELVAAGR